ncbi:MAG: NYN domain-containing protein [Gemmatimonadota bacterium]|nr:NYN domain-containing protein [Gemmatimonadota bacterium]
MASGSKKPRGVLIDGYNLLHAIPRFAPRGDPLEPAREELERWLAQAAARHGSPEVVLVWDGRSGGRWSRSTGGIRIVYTAADASADERLLELCRGPFADRSDSTWVVSSDRDVQVPARQLGFTVLGTMTFYRRWKAGGKGGGRRGGSTGPAAQSGKPRRASRAEVEDLLEDFLADRDEGPENG